MWHLPLLAEKDVKEFYRKTILGRIYKKIEEYNDTLLDPKGYFHEFKKLPQLPKWLEVNRSPGAPYKYECPELVWKLLVGPPQTLEATEAELLRFWGVDCNPDEFRKYLLLKKGKKRVGASIAKKYKSFWKVITYLFDYKSFISGSSSISYKMADIKGRNACIYCNRIYTLNVNPKAKNDSERIIRPEFDHWLSKELHPLLALSFYNLIPSCHICNSNLKGTVEFDRDCFIHPYSEEDKDLNFSFTRIPDIDGHWKIEIEDFDKLDEKVKNTIKIFKLREIYAMHSGLELDDIMRFREENSDNYLKDLVDLLKGQLRIENYGDAYRMLFGTEFEEEKFHDRPFSKLKYDILKKEGIIK